MLCYKELCLSPMSKVKSKSHWNHIPKREVYILLSCSRLYARVVAHIPFGEKIGTFSLRLMLDHWNVSVMLLMQRYCDEKSMMTVTWYSSYMLTSVKVATRATNPL